MILEPSAQVDSAPPELVGQLSFETLNNELWAFIVRRSEAGDVITCEADGSILFRSP